MNLVSTFSADNSVELNLVEFATMMHYIGEGGEMSRYLVGDYGEKKMSSTNVIAGANKMYERFNETVRDRLVEKLGPINPIIVMKNVKLDEDMNDPNPMDAEFNSNYGPNQMRCIALVSHNGMKNTMMKFVVANKNALKKFRLTGTNSTMTMLRSVFEGDDTVVFGPSCVSG